MRERSIFLSLPEAPVLFPFPYAHRFALPIAWRHEAVQAIEIRGNAIKLWAKPNDAAIQPGGWSRVPEVAVLRLRLLAVLQAPRA